MLVESHGPLGILWVGIALGAFYIALIWLNTLLGFFLTPLFIIPQTWLMDLAARRRTKRAERQMEYDASA
jgi:Flp pilus assembly protein TadB